MRGFHRSSVVAALPVGAAGLVFSVSVLAAPPKAVTAVAPPGRGQPALAVGFDEQGALRARSCPTRHCDIDGAEAIEMPDAARALRAGSKLSVVGIGKGRRAIVVDVPDEDRGRNWQAVVVAPLGGGAARTVFSGWTGLIEGQYGLRHGPLVMVSEPTASGAHRIVIGEQREDMRLCGRPAVMAPQLLSPDDLALHPAKVQRLSAEERSAALRLDAERIDDADHASHYPLLRAVAASSAVGAPEALTDGDPETTWAENRGGSGRGEFVLMHAPPALPLSAFELVVRPPTATPEHAVAPKELWLATDRKLYHVTLPEDAWQHPGARYRVTLDSPVQTECVALVTESAYGAGRKSRVTVAELSARTELDASTLEGLVGALAGGGERAQAAGAALSALGPKAFAAVASAYPRLDEGGRRVALDVIDHAPCETSVPVYVEAALSPYRAHRIHASDRIRRCGAAGAPALLAALEGAPPRAQPLIAGELALVAPSRAVAPIARLLDHPDARRRRLLRVALARAARSPKAASSVRSTLADRSLSASATLEVLRALGDGAEAFLPEAGAAFARVAKPGAAFRVRYLLLQPAAALAKRDATARSYLARAISADPSKHVRAQAARVAELPGLFAKPLLRALEDPAVRVREAAVVTLGEQHAGHAADALVRRLGDDRWPLVRAAAASALGQLGRDPRLDRALADALNDDSAHVRAPAVEALGARRARAHAEPVRELLTKQDEPVEVRVAAAAALGMMCDRESLDELTTLAHSLAEPLQSAEGRAVALVALASLARLKPPDLASRLAPLTARKAPPPTQRAADAALRARGSCGRARR